MLIKLGRSANMYSLDHTKVSWLYENIQLTEMKEMGQQQVFFTHGLFIQKGPLNPMLVFCSVQLFSHRHKSPKRFWRSSEWELTTTLAPDFFKLWNCAVGPRGLEGMTYITVPSRQLRHTQLMLYGSRVMRQWKYKLFASLSWFLIIIFLFYFLNLGD